MEPMPQYHGGAFQHASTDALMSGSRMQAVGTKSRVAHRTYSTPIIADDTLDGKQSRVPIVESPYSSPIVPNAVQSPVRELPLLSEDSNDRYNRAPVIPLLARDIDPTSVDSRNPGLAGYPEQDLETSSPPDTSQYGEKHIIGSGSSIRRSRPRLQRKCIWVLVAVGCVIVIIVAVVVPLVTRKKHQDPVPRPTGGSNVTLNGDGSLVTTDDGTTFTYKNPFGGYWVLDPENPFNNTARSQQWSPALNEPFKYGVDKIRGVNLGGWLSLEPFIAPALFQKYQSATPLPVDEWTLSLAMAADTASGGLSQLEEHYKTFITEEDFAQIAGAGLNYVRIQLPYWAVDALDGEPFLQRTSWQYFLKAIRWARKYGLRINLVLQTVPGSQNGFDHSGKRNQVNFLNGLMGIVNAERTLDYLRTITEFISQPQYASVVTMLSLVNEPTPAAIGESSMNAFNLEAYDVIRSVTGHGEGNGPYIVISEGFLGLNKFANYMPGADRLVLDDHPFYQFNEIVITSPITQQVANPCKITGAAFNQSMGDFGLTIAGEWNNAFTDCGLFVNGVGAGSRYDGTFAGSPSTGRTCADWDNYQTFTNSTKDAIKQLSLSSMDAFQNWFYFTWKTGNSPASGLVGAPLWSYQLGLQQGWIPTDPRNALGACAANGVNSPWIGTLKPSQTGGEPTVTIESSWSVLYGVWPPTSINGMLTSTIPASLSTTSPSTTILLPTYTPTGTQVTLPAPTYTIKSSGKTADAGTGWYRAQDQSKRFVPIQGCSYPDAWNAVGIPIPAACPALSLAARYAYPIDKRLRHPASPRMTTVP